MVKYLMNPQVRNLLYIVKGGVNVCRNEQNMFHRFPTLSHGLHLPLRQEAEQSARNGEAQRPRLAGPAPAAHRALQVEASQHARELQREHQLLSERGGRKNQEITKKGGERMKR